MRRDRGQLAFGLAAAFTMVLAILGLVLRSGLITREKMQIQQTNDFASLSAARVQWQSLEYLRGWNTEIEYKFWQTEDALITPPSPCNDQIIEPLMKGLGGVALETTVGVRTRETGGCDDACNKYDSKIRKQIINDYRRFRNGKAFQIAFVLAATNIAAYEEALKTYFLDVRNLPVGMQQVVTANLGPKPTSEMMLDAYRKGTFTDMFALLGGRINDRDLFDAEEEKRFFQYRKHYYRAYHTEAGTACAPGDSIGNEREAVGVKIYRSSDRNTSFITEAVYRSSAEDPLRKWNLPLKNMDARDAEKFGEPLTDPYGKKRHVFDARIPMGVKSVAMPYGGKYPQNYDGADETKALSTVGEEFKGVKLAGLADTTQLGERLDSLDGCIKRTDAEGHERECVPYYTEDYLH